MGADLYIEKITNVTSKKWRKKWEEVCKIPFGGLSEDEQEKLSKKTDYYWDKMYPANAYYRDSYNDSNLLWKFGISYWVDINRMVDKRGLMSPDKAKDLLILLKHQESVFKKNLRNFKSHSGNHEAEYFEKKYKKFKKFLNNAIKLNSSIRCSI
jgi:hypothetical protein